MAVKGRFRPLPGSAAFFRSLPVSGSPERSDVISSASEQARRLPRRTWGPGLDDGHHNTQMKLLSNPKVKGGLVTAGIALLAYWAYSKVRHKLPAILQF